MRKVTFANDHIYHIFNRGTDKRKIFLNKKDYERLFTIMSLFNDSNNGQLHLSRIDNEHPSLNKTSSEPLVDILCFCLMPNHYHLLLRQKEKNGISKYMHRLQMGYSKYFNTRYKRSGNLFQGAYKVVEINKDNQFRYVPLYIHMNPLDLVENKWKENGIKNIKKAINFLKEYPWSSLKIYSESKTPHYLETTTVSSLYSPRDWEEEIQNCLKSPKAAGQHSVLTKVEDFLYV